MTHKYEKKCWSCGSTDMENKGSYAQCKSCGATWNEIPKGGELPFMGEGSRVSAGNMRYRKDAPFTPK